MAGNFIGASSQWVNLGLSLNVLNNVPAGSMSVWVKLNGVPTTTLRIFAISVGPPPGTSAVPRFVLAVTSTAKVRFTGCALDNDATGTVDGTVTIADQTWTHVAVVCDYAAGIVSIYINGVLDVSSVLTGSTLGNTSPTNAKCGALGATPTGASSFFAGLIEDARLYNRRLSPGEILTIFTSKGKDGIWNGCQMRYMLAGGAPGSTIIQAVDLGSANRAGAPTNAPTYSAGIVSSRQKRAVKYRY